MAPAMNIATLSILSLLPIITVAVFLVGLRWPASRAMPLSYGVAIVLALVVWQVPAVQIAAASINGLVVALTVLYIIFGAILLLNTLQEGGALKTIREGFTEHHARPPGAGHRDRLAVRIVHRGLGRLRHARRGGRAAAGRASASPAWPRSWPA